MAEQIEYDIEQTMSHILEIRYTDIELEQRLSLELLQYAQKQEDVYVKAFAYAYLGDSYIANNDMERAGNALKKAEKLLEEDEFKENPDQKDRLYVRVASLLGVYYEITADEQTSIQYYLTALAATRRIKDTNTECMVLNNLALEFQRHSCYDMAQKYLMEAYELQKKMGGVAVCTQIISNLVHMNVKMGNMETARIYCEECDAQETDPAIREKYGRINWCCYYAEAGELEKAKYLAGLILDDISDSDIKQFGAFEELNIICDSILKIEDAEYAKRSLEVLEKCSIGSLEECQLLEDKRLRYSILFGSEQEQDEAYRRFYKKSLELKAQTNRNVVNAMKDKMYLETLRRQKAKMQIEQDRLEKQANLDELTGIYNRRYLDYLTDKHKTAETTEETFGVIMLDVDYFKEYNDYYGHVQGDNVLRTIASCLKNNQTEGILACRFGGDEFISICKSKTDEEIEAYIEAVREDLDHRCIVHKESKCSDRITLSIGYANRLNTPRNEIHLLFWLADKALYDSKLSGRNTYRKK